VLSIHSARIEGAVKILPVKFTAGGVLVGISRTPVLFDLMYTSKPAIASEPLMFRETISKPLLTPV
jgi:hypothetical protein